MTITGDAPAVRFPGRAWDPAGHPRAIVTVLPGRGEPPEVYERLGTRLAAEGYRVHAVGLGADPPHPGDLAAELRRVSGGSTVPCFLLGADTGALWAMRMSWYEPRPAALVLAGLPGDPEWTPGTAPGLPGEIELRATSAERRAALREDGRMRPGELLRRVPAGLRDVTPDSLPTLVLHGEADVLSPSLAARQRVVRWPRSRFVTVAASGHDVLHDTHERSVAAEVLQFLERFRVGAAPVLRPSPRAAL